MLKMRNLFGIFRNVCSSQRRLRHIDADKVTGHMLTRHLLSCMKLKEPLPRDYLRFNMDATFDRHTGNSAVAGILRDFAGEPQLHFYCHLKEKFQNPSAPELFAFEIALRIARDEGLDLTKIRFEVDCDEVVKTVEKLRKELLNPAAFASKSRKSAHDFTFKSETISEIKALMSVSPNLEVKGVVREVNFVVDKLAVKAMYLPEGDFCMFWKYRNLSAEHIKLIRLDSKIEHVIRVTEVDMGKDTVTEADLGKDTVTSTDDVALNDEDDVSWLVTNDYGWDNE
ncbi:hypothetical protein CASFOL_014784 [Castilleja foliolosa]|uniref:RNase H type-1 domain-containing protein n=1 Tax=Castilleja foliolosa TaxID=1961234 RepID=A0ABD3DBV0_9LAMI